MSVTMLLLSIKDLAVAIPPERGLLRITHHYINKGQNWSRLFVRERVELLIELLGGVSRQTLADAENVQQS